MFLFKLLLRLWLASAHLWALWSSGGTLAGQQHDNTYSTSSPLSSSSSFFLPFSQQQRQQQQHAVLKNNAAAAPAPLVGIAARQGRRFTMEDRAVSQSGPLLFGGRCRAVNYTYAAGRLVL